MTTAAQDRITRRARTAAKKGGDREEARRVTRLLVTFTAGQVEALHNQRRAYSAYRGET
jgi:hypothetical protein